jgi:transcriptional regulator with XRE-family HTH domain
MRVIKALFSSNRNHALHARKYAFAMKKSTVFSERLEEALRIGGKDRQQLAHALGISIQAVSQILLGKTKAMTAENCVRAARLTGVDSFWLATGSGEAVGHRAGAPQWPFRATFEEYDRLGDEQKKSLDIIVSEFIRSSLFVERDDWGAPKATGVIAPSKPAKRLKHG